MLNDNPHDEHGRITVLDFHEMALGVMALVFGSDEAPLAATENRIIERNHLTICRTCRAELRDTLRGIAYRTGYSATMNGQSDFEAVWPWARLMMALPRALRLRPWELVLIAEEGRADALAELSGAVQ